MVSPNHFAFCVACFAFCSSLPRMVELLQPPHASPRRQPLKSSTSGTSHSVGIRSGCVDLGSQILRARGSLGDMRRVGWMRVGHEHRQVRELDAGRSGKSAQHDCRVRRAKAVLRVREAGSAAAGCAGGSARRGAGGDDGMVANARRPIAFGGSPGVGGLSRRQPICRGGLGESDAAEHAGRAVGRRQTGGAGAVDGPGHRAHSSRAALGRMTAKPLVDLPKGLADSALTNGLKNCRMNEPADAGCSRLGSFLIAGI